ncbi:hypothetical protein KO561_02190 [Radiobacillus kanasensis]|uniref:hypothetical protein n=1 Tax=Radiobacillus kanasensis TaxID=2844358 RepID=UPI001E33D615|nr:hypothetical protein [Radiobacillus kanasensis]UFT99807.1 hypothetical protein KO561_02190 [Radiobacillus kanasensis]
MMASPTVSAYIDLKKNRWKKKKKIYKLALGVSFDVTISIYFGLFLIMGLFIAYDMLQQYQNQFLLAEEMVKANGQNLIIVFILRYVMGSFTRPGVLFSSAELQLSLLPYSLRQLWFCVVIEKWLKFTVLCLVGATLVYILTPISGQTILWVVGLTWATHVLMTVPQWVLFQYGWIPKVTILVALFNVSILSVILDQSIPLVPILIVGLGLVQFFLRRSILRANWLKIAQTNDFIVWNMWFVSRMSKMEIKPKRQFGFLQSERRKKKQKQPFPYESDDIYKKMWMVFFREKIEYVLKTIGIVLLLSVVLSLQSDLLMGIGVGLSIFVFGKMTQSLFLSHFTDRLLITLPWDIRAWTSSYFAYVGIVGLVLLLLIGNVLYWMLDVKLWLPILLAFYGIVAVYFVKLQVREAIRVLTKQNKMPAYITGTIIIVLFAAVMGSTLYPWLSACGLLAVFSIWRDYKDQSRV